MWSNSVKRSPFSAVELDVFCWNGCGSYQSKQKNIIQTKHQVENFESGANTTTDCDEILFRKIKLSLFGKQMEKKKEKEKE